MGHGSASAKPQSNAEESKKEGKCNQLTEIHLGLRGIFINSSCRLSLFYH